MLFVIVVFKTSRSIFSHIANKNIMLLCHEIRALRQIQLLQGPTINALAQ